MHNVYIPWKKQNDQYWNELCARVVEHFGLPGDRFTTHPETDWMTFSFNDEQDALMCRMLLSEHIVERTSWTVTVEEDGVITFPDEVLEKTGWQEGDTIDWQELGDGSFLLKKVV